MSSRDCARVARKHIGADVRRRLLQHSNFGCSICGNIPIVLHHIEEWSKNFSNDEELLIPVCTPCHSRVHGEGGALFSKDELYEYKANPKRPLVLTDRLPLERKKEYAFFVGSNFVNYGTRASFFGVLGEHDLLTVDTSTGCLLLSVLAEVRDDREVYLIKDNELLIDTADLWDMRYSGNSLRVWKSAGSKRNLFVDIALKPDVIIIREMQTTFDDRPFRVYRFRRPQKRQLEKIKRRVEYYEDIYRKQALEIDQGPNLGFVYEGLDIGTAIKQSEKGRLKEQRERELIDWCRAELDWDLQYIHWVLNRVLAESSVFARTNEGNAELPDQFGPLNEMIAEIRSRYSEEFMQMEDILAEFDGFFMTNNIQVVLPNRT